MDKEKKSRANRWHAMEAEEAVRQLGSHAAAGLSPKEAASRLRRAGVCRLWQVSRASASQILFGEFLDFAAILLVITAAVAAVFERGGEAAAICVLLVVSALLRTGTALTAQRIFEEAAKENIPRASVIRGGRYLSLTAEDVVPGDILLLSPGDTAACDVRLIAGEVDVLETAVSGRKELCRKNAAEVLAENTPCPQRSNIVFASSSVVSGSARGIAIAVGEHTYAYARRGYITVRCETEIGVMQKLTGWCRSVSLAMTAAVLLITMGGLFLGNSGASIESLFLSALALAVASMSEFLCVIASNILACSVRMLSSVTKNGTVIKNAAAIETYARTDAVVFASEAMLQSDNLSIGAWYSDGSSHSAPVPQKGEGALLALLQWCAICSGGGTLALSAGGEGLPENEFYTLAQKFLHMYSGETTALSAPVSAAACTADAHLHTALIPQENAVYAYVCGGLEDVLACCSNVLVNGVPQPISHEMRAALTEDAVSCRRRCTRTVAVAMRLSPYNNLTKVSAIQNKMNLIGYFTVLNPVEASLTRYVSKCRAGGIRMAVLTEDPDSARYLAGEAGILGEGDRYIATASPDAVGDWLESSDTACAVIRAGSPEEKAAVVKALREGCGKTVFVGSEMSDLSAFAEADASVAVFPGSANHPQCVQRRADTIAGRGSDEPRNAPAFEALRVIGYCKNALVNLRGAAEYLLISQVIRLTLMLTSVTMGLPLMSPLQILIWGLLLDFAAVLTLAFRTPRLGILETPSERTELPSLRSGLIFSTVSGVLCAVLLSAVPWIAEALGLPADDAMSAYILYAGGILAAFVALCQTMFSGQRAGGGIRIHAAYLVYLVMLLVVLTAAALHSGITWQLSSVGQLALAAVPALVLFVLGRIYACTNDTERHAK